MEQDVTWQVPGAQVALVTQRGVRLEVERTTIARLTKTQLVLANGARFPRVPEPRRRGATMWDPATELVAAEDPRVARGEQQRRRRDCLGAVSARFEELRRRPSPDSARALVAAANAYAELLEQPLP